MMKESTTAQYVEIVDITFVQVGTNASIKGIMAPADSIASELCHNFPDTQNTVLMVIGEMAITYHLVRLLKEKHYTCVACKSERISSVDDNDIRTSKFEVVKFREY